MIWKILHFPFHDEYTVIVVSGEHLHHIKKNIAFLAADIWGSGALSLI
jgi:hypothetical protein